MKKRLFLAVIINGKLTGKVGLATAMNDHCNVIFYLDDDKFCLKVTDIQYLD